MSNLFKITISGLNLDQCVNIVIEPIVRTSDFKKIESKVKIIKNEKIKEGVEENIEFLSGRRGNRRIHNEHKLKLMNFLITQAEKPVRYSDIEKNTGIPHGSISIAIKELVKENVIARSGITTPGIRGTAGFIYTILKKVEN